MPHLQMPRLATVCCASVLLLKISGHHGAVCSRDVHCPPTSATFHNRSEIYVSDELCATRETSCLLASCHCKGSPALYHELIHNQHQDAHSRGISTMYFLGRCKDHDGGGGGEGGEECSICSLTAMLKASFQDLPRCHDIPCMHAMPLSTKPCPTKGSLLQTSDCSHVQSQALEASRWTSRASMMLRATCTIISTLSAPSHPEASQQTRCSKKYLF